MYILGKTRDIWRRAPFENPINCQLKKQLIPLGMSSIIQYFRLICYTVTNHWWLHCNMQWFVTVKQISPKYVFICVNFQDQITVTFVQISAVGMLSLIAVSCCLCSWITVIWNKRRNYILVTVCQQSMLYLIRVRYGNEYTCLWRGRLDDINSGKQHVQMLV